MLVLSRQREESIVIDLSGQAVIDWLMEQKTLNRMPQIVITQVDIRGDKSRIGIQAPTVIEVHRLEIYEKIHLRDAEHK